MEIMQFADDCRERALAPALIAKDSKASSDPLTKMWLTLAVLEDQLVLWADRSRGNPDAVLAATSAVGAAASGALLPRLARRRITRGK